MTNNFHIFIVHFPVGLLSLYVFLEVLSIFKIAYKKQSLEITKAILLVTGVVGAILSRITGDSISHALRPYIDRKTLMLHEGMSLWIVVVFGIIALVYMLTLIETFPEITQKKWYTSPVEKVVHTLKKYTALLQKRFMLVALSLIGFILLLLTGALGGILAHGCSTDFIARDVCSIFSITE